MVTKVYWVHELNNGARLGIMARPRGNEWLEEEIVLLKKQHVQMVVSLLEWNEIFELGLLNQESLCQKLGVTYFNFPIPDRSVPGGPGKVDELVSQLSTNLSNGVSVVIHCRMGIGRSSIIAGAVLLKFGLKADDIIKNICRVRGLRVPDTEQQLEWLRKKQ